MATTNNGIKHDINHYAGFKSYIPTSNIIAAVSDTTKWAGPGATAAVEVVIDSLVGTGLITVSTLFEHALAAVGGHTVTSVVSEDLSDGSDAKLATTLWHGSGKKPLDNSRYMCNPGYNVWTTSDGSERHAPTAYGATVSGLDNKTGKLRVQVYEEINDKHYWFVIPHTAYAGKKSIEIPFTYAGLPCEGGYWDYQVFTFEELATN